MFRQLFVFLAVVATVLGSVIPKFERDPKWEGRIIGGSVAGTAQFPHQASLRTAGNAHFCGASIVNSRWIVSAAHCTVGRTTANTRVVVGTNSRTAGGINHLTSAIINHPEYNANTIANDVSVVQTSTVITMTNAVQPMPLGSATVGGGVAATISGWGQTSNPGTGAVNLMFLNVQTLTVAACRAAHTPGNAQFVFETSLCAAANSNQGTCMGDSGGPLISGGNVIGLVSWGIACATGFPDTYARVSSFRSWIVGYTS